MSINRRHLVTAAVASTFLARKDAAIAAPKAPSRAATWDPATTWVFAVGVLAYPDGDNWPQKGRRDAVMLDELRAAGVPKEQIEFIRDKDAKHKTVVQRFAAFLSKAPAGATLWFYFAGHGDKTEDGIGTFVLYDQSWPIPDLFTAIERHFAGRTGLLFADCCYSGNLCAEAMTRAGRIAYATLTSSLASTVSTGAWTFTDCLIQGLKGAAQVDADGDGILDFLELASYAEREMAANDGQLSTFAAVNGFDPRMALRSGVRRTHPRIGSYVSAKAKDGSWSAGRIDAAKDERFLIKWVGYDDSRNEWVAVGDTKELTRTQHAPGTKVSVEWKRKWYPAEVISGRLGMHLIHYDGYDAIWDEWVAPERVRVR